jgi:signal transduction histidine kinase
VLRSVLVISKNPKLASKKFLSLFKRHKFEVFFSSPEMKEIEKKIYDNFIEIIFICCDIPIKQRVNLCKRLYKKYPNKLYFTHIRNIKNSCDVKNCKLLRENICKSAFLFFPFGENLIKRFKFLIKRNFSSILGNISKKQLDILGEISKETFLPIMRKDISCATYSPNEVVNSLEYLSKNIGVYFVDEIKKQFLADKISFFSYDANRDNYVLVASYGYIKDKEPIVMDRKWKLMNKVVSSRKPLLIQNGVIYYPEIQKLKIKPQPKIVSSMVLPMIVNNRVIGVLNIARISPKKERFTELDFNLAQYWCSWMELIYSIILGFKLVIEYEKLKSDLVAVVNHELRTPLMSISAGLELISGEISQELAGLIYRNIQRLYNTIEQLLDFSKISKGTLVLEKQSASISSIVEEIFETYKEVLEEKNIKFIIEKDFKEDICFLDKLRIKQVISNLISNSIKFIPEEKKEKYIKFSVKETEKEYVFSVEDNGKGIKKEDIEKLFIPFIQIGDIMTEHKPGLGLGLFISKYIVEEHRGRIWVESEFGKWTRVSFTIPK